tara:strand:- start:186 stop:878 length:693 start_codon:yes stop_codon:yes gene_type:complete
MLLQINEVIIYFLTLTIRTDLLWIIIPLFIATILMVIYFEIYKSERPEWSAYLANSLVLLFISIALFRYIYHLDVGGAYNFVEYWQKTSATALILLIGGILLKFNFEHVLPERISRKLSSPVTINVFAYIVILFIYSTIKANLVFIISLIILYIILYLVFFYLRFPIKIFSGYMDREKRKERLNNVKEAVYQTDELKRELKSRNKELKNIKKKEIVEKQKEAQKLKKIVS